ncbi:MAG: protein kinase domain-containing protein, partial [Polyangia bacterium]
MAVPAYTDVHAIHSGARFTVMRARRRDGLSVVIKDVRTDRVELRAVDRLKHEHELLRGLDLPGIARPLAFTTIDGKPALVEEDLGRRSLADLLGAGPLLMGPFLELALPMARLVGQLHERGVIHRDLCPANFIVTERPPG